MPSPPFASRAAAIALASSCFSLVSSQAVPGASYLAGGGVPNSGQYQLVDDYQPSGFFSKFAFYDSYDPTYGHVQYVNETVAETNGYVSVTDQDSVIIKPDTSNLWPNGGLGRPSVRITSKNTYLHGLFILDLTHMPWGCGTWPAYWLLGPNWPYTGEIDIIEGVNTLESDTMTLHTSDNCTIAGSGQTADFQTADCYYGCGSVLENTTSPNNYGSSFNENQGGVYVTEWTSEYIQHWFFPRGSIPSSISDGAPDISQFGTPAFNAQGDCDIDSHFQNMSVIINIDFCGAWAGTVYDNYPECPQSSDPTVSSLNSCVDFVGSNPSALGEAYFEINSLQVYQMSGAIQTTAPYSTSLSSITTGLATTDTIQKGQGAATTGSSYSSAVEYIGPLSASLVSSLAASSSAPANVLPASSASCPGSDGQTVVDGCGVSYIIKCNSDTSFGSPGAFGVDSFNDCFQACSSGANGVCSAFTYSISTKNCYLKGFANEQFAGGSTDLIGAINVQFYGSNTPDPSTTSRVCTVQSVAASSSIMATSRSVAATTTVRSSTSSSSPPSTSRSSSAVPSTSPSPSMSPSPSLSPPAPSVSTAAVSSLDAGSTPGSCISSFDGIYHFQLASVSNPQETFGPDWELSLSNGVVENDKGQTLYLDSNYQVVFATSAPSGTTYSSGWCLGSDSLLYLQDINLFCYYSDGTTYYDFYEQLGDLGVCESVYIQKYGRPVATVSSLIVSGGITSTSLAVSTSNGQWVTSSVALTVSSGVTSTSVASMWSSWSDVPPAVSSISDGQIPFSSTSVSSMPSSSLQPSMSTSLVVSNGQTSTMVLPVSSSPRSSYHSHPSSTSLIVSLIAVSSSVAPAASSTSLWISNGVTSTSIIPIPMFSSSTIAPNATSSNPSSTTSSAANTATSLPFPPCPTSDICGSAVESYTCSSSDASSYSLSCGKIWVGTVIPDSQVQARSVEKRVYAASFGTCQSICDANAACVAINYIGTNCTLFSTVTGQQTYYGAVTAAQVPDNEPSCPNAANKVFTDSNGETYTIGCYNSYAANDIGNPIFEPAFSSCLPYCDALSGCVGVEYDTSQNLCYLKSSFLGTQTSDNSRIIGQRNSVSPIGGSATDMETVTATTTISVQAGAGTVTVTQTLSGPQPPTSTTSSTLDGGGSVSLCVTCGLIPTVVDNPGTQPSPTIYPSGGANVITITQTNFGTCPTSRPETGTTTIFSTQTITSCEPQPVCPNPGYGIIGGSTSYSGAITVTTTNGNGVTVTYREIPTGSGNGGPSSTPKGSNGGNNPTSTPIPTPTPIPTGTTPSSNLPTCPYAQGSVYIDPMGNQWKILCDTLFTDIVLSTGSAPRLADCINSCDMYNLQNMYATDLCQGVSWVSGLTTNNCLLKNGGTGVLQIGTHSALLLTRLAVPGNGTVPGDGSTVSLGTMSSVPTSGGGGGSGPSGYGPGAPVTTIIGGSTVYSTYVTTSGGSTMVATQTNIVGGSTMVSTVGNGPGGVTTSAPSVYGVSTAYSYRTSGDATYTSTYLVSTMVPVMRVDTETVTTTTVSISGYVTTQYIYSTVVSNGITTVVSTQYVVSTAYQYSTIVAHDGGTVVSTAYIISTVQGPGGVTQTIAGPTQTVQVPGVTQTVGGITQTIAGPTQTIVGPGGVTQTIVGPAQTIVQTVSGPTQTVSGPVVTTTQRTGIVTVTETIGSGSVIGTTTDFVTVTKTIYLSASSSVSSSTCRLTSTNYLAGATPI